ncbi:MAG: 4Fe-4S dicluster domain-containing protein [bacterium]|nr:MAG: 4Fe-4S dicluster domain-containing protein [bacterium]
MRIIKLKKDKLFLFFEIISDRAEFWAPVKKGDKHIFKAVNDFSEIELNTTRTILPPKKIFLPPSFSMFNVSEKGYEEDFSHITNKILFGIHPCDINGLLILDNFFEQSYPDPYYLEARKNTLILGLSCWPDEYCFAKSTNTHIIEEGFDLFFTDLKDFFLVWIGSSQGDDLIRLKPELFDENLTDQDIQTYINWNTERDKTYKESINFTVLPDLMELEYMNPLWEKLGNACLACGSCSNVCPTCNCYNVMDKQFLGGKDGKIIRHWDSCTLEEYSEVAGGENFREKSSNRLKLWYTHKLQAFISKYGKPSCVGCGRCVATCPVDINIRSVGKSLLGEKVDAFWNKYNNEVAI